MESAVLPIDPVPRGASCWIRTSNPPGFKSGRVYRFRNRRLVLAVRFELTNTAVWAPQLYRFATPAKLVRSLGFEPREFLGLNEATLPDLSSRAWCSGRGSNSQQYGSQPYASTKLRHPNMVGRPGFEPGRFTQGVTGATAQRFHPLTHRPKTQIVKDLGGEPGTRTPMRRSCGFLAGIWAACCPCSPRC